MQAEKLFSKQVVIKMPKLKTTVSSISSIFYFKLQNKAGSKEGSYTYDQLAIRPQTSGHKTT